MRSIWRPSRRAVDAALDRLTPADSAHPATIHRAMRYSLFAGGKRIRPILCLARRGGDWRWRAARRWRRRCALEMIHTYSLIHDDLPALDNDDYRRGKPTCHKVFGEAMAILAGDALLTLALQTLSKIEGLEASARGRAGARTFDRVGDGGWHDRRPGDRYRRREAGADGRTARPIHRAKTGALLRASVRMGGICAGADEAQIAALSAYGEHVGLAFQIVDDILDVEESSEALGKTAGKDAAQGKITFPAVYGLDESRRMANEECRLAHEALAPFGDAARAAARNRRPDRPPKVIRWRRHETAAIAGVMVDRGLVESREKAQALIMAGEVLVDGPEGAEAGPAGGGGCGDRADWRSCAT